MTDQVFDVVLVGGGIVSATLASLIQRAEPSWTVKIFERLDQVTAEATDGWHNSGTGHAALCELNYTPADANGNINISKAVKIHQQFLTSCEYWASLVSEGALGAPESFINSTPHMSYVQGDDDVAFLAARHRAMTEHHFFADIEFSDEPNLIGQWAPLLIEGRDLALPMAATYAVEGTDVDFGSLTRQLFADVVERGAQVELETEVIGLTRQSDGGWQVITRNVKTGVEVETLAKTVLLGAGGWTLKLLRSARDQQGRPAVPEVRGYGLLPISGKFLKSENPEVVAQHQVKVYGQAPIGAPPMSVPHLDARVIDGKRSVLFGPFAGAIPRFLTNGTNWDFVQGLKPDNLWPLVTMGVANLNLLGFLLRDLTASKSSKIDQLRDFLPLVDEADWDDLVAGQRAQIVKPASNGHGELQFGTEVITSNEGTLAGVLGASPGASTAVSIALDVLQRCFPERYGIWQKNALNAYLPSLGRDLANDAEATAVVKGRVRKVLRLRAE